MATFRREASAAVSDAFARALALQHGQGLAKVGAIGVDSGTAGGRGANRRRSVRSDRAGKLEAPSRAEMADASSADVRANRRAAFPGTR